MNQIEIRVAVPEDAQAVQKIYSYYVLNTAVTSEYVVPTVEEFEGRIRKVLKKYPFIVAMIDGEVVGYAYAREFHDRAAYAWSCETSIYVEKDHHHLGVGRRLYEHLEELLKKQRIVNMYACVSYPEEKSDYLTMDSCLFHMRMGFMRVGEFHHCRYKFDGWYNMTWMEKTISPLSIDPPAFIPFEEL